MSCNNPQCACSGHEQYNLRPWAKVATNTADTTYAREPEAIAPPPSAAVVTYEGLGRLLDARDSAAQECGIATDRLLDAMLTTDANERAEALAQIVGYVREIDLIDRLRIAASLVRRNEELERVAREIDGEETGE